MNASEIVADRLIQRGIYLERYKAGLNIKILAELEKLEDGLTQELVALFSKGVANPTQRVQRLEKLLGQTRHVIRRAYAEKKSLSGKELTRLAANEQAYVVDAINDTVGIEFADRMLNYDELKKLTDETLIQGARSAEWWNRQSDDLQKRFSDQMRQGVLRGETLDQLSGRVRGTQAKAFTDGVMQVSKRQADALVRSSVQAVANSTRLESFKANPEVVNAIQWVSTLDSRTTHICMALSGKMWTTATHAPIGHSFAFPGPTAHWACRSTQVAVIKSWEELVAGQDKAALDTEFQKQLKAQGFSDEAIAKISRDTRASMDGQVAKDLSFDDWLGAKSPDFQDKLLGKGRAKLFRDKKITLTDLVDQRLRPLTIDELEALPYPRPPQKPIKLPSRRKKPPVPVPATRAVGEFPPITEVERVKKLGGTTGAELVKDTKGPGLYVQKKGASADHIREEFGADQAYRAAGVDVPRGVLYDTPTGPVKLTEFIDGRNLGDYLAKATPAEAEAVLAKVRKGFVTDALLANHDVAGLSLDNILVDAKGIPWRIDNGGSLRFRAQGLPKSSATWNGAVQELETLRDAAVNPQTARIFAGLTDSEIDEQIRDLLTRESAILDAVPESARAVLKQRFDTLRARLDALINDEVAKRAASAEIKGISLPSDRDEFEDVQLLTWGELDEQGNAVTMAKIKLTPNGSEKVMEAIRDSIPAKAPAAPVGKPLPQDSFWAKIEVGVKTISTHAGDGKYNVAKVKSMEAAKAELLALETPTSALQQMKAHYLEVIDKAEGAMKAKVKPSMMSQFVVTPPVKTPKVSAISPKFSIKEEPLTWPIKTYAKGVARRTAQPVTIKGTVLKQEGYVVQLGGATVRFIPYRAVANAKNLYSLDLHNAQALMGTLEIEVKGAVSRETLNRAVAAIQEIGLSPKKATSDYMEAVWLRKTLAMRTDVVDNAVRDRIRDIMELDGITDVDRVAQLRTIAKEKLGIEPPRDPAQWTPKPDADGRGWGTTPRWDIDSKDLAEKMSGHVMTHHTDTNLPELVGKLLEQGGELTSTAERVRKGIDITSGMSPEADLIKGGATHLYTRIKSKAVAYAQPGFVFKTETLARQDAFAFRADWYGGVSDFFETKLIYDGRGKTVADFKAFAKAGGNETLFKWGLSLLSDLDAIVVTTNAERLAIIDRFKRSGITKLADGRAVADVVTLTGKKK